MSWTLREGLILDHKEADRRVEVLGRKEVAGMVFWEVAIDSHSTSKESPWLIHEPCLLEEYSPKRES